MREVQDYHPVDRTHRQGCRHCGCSCRIIGAAPRGSGRGSQVLSPSVMGNLLREYALSYQPSSPH
jgi:hypothetical protein